MSNSSNSWEELRARVRKAEHDEGQLEFLRGQVEHLTRPLAERDARLRSEARDLEELEGLSLAALLARVFGTREGQLEKERREWVEAKLARDHVRDEIEKLRRRVRELEAQAAEREEARRLLHEAVERVITDWITLRRVSASRERVGQLLEAVRAFELRLQLEESELEHALARDRRKYEERWGRDHSIPGRSSEGMHALVVVESSTGSGTANE